MNYLSLPGTINNYASAPHTAAMDITGDIDMRVFLAADTWKAGSGQVLFSMWAGGTNSAYQLFISNAGVFSLFWEDTVPSTRNANCTQNLTTIFNTGVPIWLRATLKVDNGAAGRDIKFYSSNDGQTWAQLGSTVTQAGTTAINLCTDVLTVGIQHAATQPFSGKVFYAELRNGINGTIVANPDFRGNVSSGFSDSAGNVWSVNAAGTPPVPVAQIMQRAASEYLLLPGKTTNAATCPDSASLKITGNIDVRVLFSPDKWQSQPSPSAVGSIISKDGSGRIWHFRYTPTAFLHWGWWDAGNAFRTNISTVRVPFNDQSAVWCRVTFSPSTGTSTFYTSQDGVTWAQLGSPVVFGATALRTDDSVITVGATGPSSDRYWPGKVFYAEVRDGINGTVVASPDFRSNVASGFSDARGNVWTISTSGSPPAALTQRTLAAA